MAVVLSLRPGNKMGNHTPPTSLQNLLSGILTYMRNVHGDTPDFLSKKDWRFRELRGTMERIFSNLREQGVGAEVKHTDNHKRRGRSTVEG